MFDPTIIKEIATEDFTRVFEEDVTIDEMYRFIDKPTFSRDIIAIRFLLSRSGEVDDFEPTVWFINPIFWKENLHHDYHFKEFTLDDYEYIEIVESFPFLPSEIIPEVLTLPQEYFEEFDILKEYESFRNRLLKIDRLFEQEELFHLFANFLANKRVNR